MGAGASRGGDEEAVDECDDEVEQHMEDDEGDEEDEQGEDDEEEEVDDEDAMLAAMQFDNAESLQQLMDMGFPQNRARKALQINRGHVQMVRK